MSDNRINHVEWDSTFFEFKGAHATVVNSADRDLSKILDQQVEDGYKQVHVIGIYDAQNNLQGFISVKIKNDVANIDLIAIDSRFQGKGIRGDLLQLVENFDCESVYNTMLVATQAVNNRTVDFYQQYGYKEDQGRHIYHIWQ